MRYTVILNPAARYGRAGRWQSRLVAAFREAGLAAEVFLTESQGHATALAAAASHTADVVVAAGGDGTVHEVAQGLVEGGGGAALAVVPVGTGNDFAHALGMPPDPLAAVRALATARRTAIDYGLVTWHDDAGMHEAPFFNNVGAGLDALATAYGLRTKVLPGTLGYWAAVVAALVRWQAPPARLTDAEGGVRFEAPLLFAAVSNGPRTGGDFYLAPDASITDGCFDVCIARYAPRRRLLRLLPLAHTGTHLAAPEVDLVRLAAGRLVLDAPVPVHADGEVITHTAREIAFRLVPGGLPALLHERFKAN